MIGSLLPIDSATEPGVGLQDNDQVALVHFSCGNTWDVPNVFTPHQLSITAYLSIWSKVITPRSTYMLDLCLTLNRAPDGLTNVTGPMTMVWVCTFQQRKLRTVDAINGHGSPEPIWLLESL